MRWNAATTSISANTSPTPCASWRRWSATAWCAWSATASSPRPVDASSCVISPCASTDTFRPRTPWPRRVFRAPSERRARAIERPRAVNKPDANQVAFPRTNAKVLADDGDPLRFCSTCAFSQACLDQGMDKRALMDLHVLVEHVGPFHAGDHVFREGDPFEAIAAVRAGTVKTYTIDRDGREHVLGFHLPGELIGLNAIAEDRFPCNAIALDTVTLCRFSFPKISVLAARLPRLQQTLFQLLSRDIGTASLLAGDWSADERMAAFLVRLSRRLAARGFSPDRFQLTMSRTDIANYLRLAPETVSRVLKRFQADGLLKVDRRELELIHRDQLEALAAPILRH